MGKGGLRAEQGRLRLRDTCRWGYLVEDNFSISFFESFNRSILVCSDVDTDTEVALQGSKVGSRDYFFNRGWKPLVEKVRLTQGW